MESEFPQNAGLIYLNHAGVGPWPRRTGNAVCDFAFENVSAGPIDYEAWIHTETVLREQLRQMINAPSIADIALMKNTSEALSTVAYGIEWNAGDNIVTTRQEFPSNRIVWESLRTRGVETRLADLDSTSIPEDAVAALTDRRTRLIAISSVQYASGLRVDLQALGEFCRARNIFFCIDAIQSIGAVTFDAQKYHADFVVADGHKWMLGPEGVALFYCRAELRERLKVQQFGWHMVEAVGNYDAMQWEPARSARRFECGSPNMLGIHALSASLSLLLEIGMNQVEKLVLEKSSLLIARLSADARFKLLTPTQVGRYAGIVNCRHRHENSEQLARVLKERQIFCAVRAGGIRFSPHFYTQNEQLEKALEVLFELAPR
ncbi:MAG: class V aminotransferase [Gammaproteobacteria bacterium]|nr:MAG: class V aminotransferase [Gammaproteobacteria bacterium]TND06869.1 MAG: class V aminotransferase [Gammaproteobacteria bacterium]